jgi:hypothetical protein
MSHEQNRAVDFSDHACQVIAVASSQSAQWVRRRDDCDVLIAKLVVQEPKAGCVSERSVHEDDRGGCVIFTASSRLKLGAKADDLSHWAGLSSPRNEFHPG